MVEKLNQALQTSKINSAPELDIRTVLGFVLTKLGIREQNIPNEMEMEILVDHLREHYAGNTVAEIKLAFEMAISGKLDFGKDGGSANPYENFSCLYVSNVMNAYRKWARVAYTEIKQPELPALPPPHISDEEIIDTARKLYATTKQFMYISEKAFSILKIELSPEDQLRIKGMAARKLGDMYFTDPNLFQNITRERYQVMIEEKIAVAEYFQKENEQPLKK